MTKATCSVPGCDRPVSGWGWCSAHYWRWRKHGDVDITRPVRLLHVENPHGMCSVAGCHNPACNGRGWCWAHYQRMLRHGSVRAEIPVRLGKRTVEDRYLSFFIVTGLDDCYPWTGALGNDGYGRFYVNEAKRSARAHVWGYEHFIGPIPDGMEVCHTCDNPLCQNQRHWFLGTVAENAQDMVNKGRSLFGERNHKAKLTWAQVDEIRARYALGNITQRSLAYEFRVNPTTIGEIVTYRSWNSPHRPNR